MEKLPQSEAHGIKGDDAESCDVEPQLLQLSHSHQGWQPSKHVGNPIYINSQQSHGVYHHASQQRRPWNEDNSQKYAIGGYVIGVRSQHLQKRLEIW